jgi:hypothetical protein
MENRPKSRPNFLAFITTLYIDFYHVLPCWIWHVFAKVVFNLKNLEKWLENFQILSWASLLVDVACYKIGTQHYQNYQSHTHENMHTHHDGCFVILLCFLYLDSCGVQVNIFETWKRKLTNHITGINLPNMKKLEHYSHWIGFQWQIIN